MNTESHLGCQQPLGTSGRLDGVLANDCDTDGDPLSVALAIPSR